MSRPPLISGRQRPLRTARLDLAPLTRDDSEDVVRLDAIAAVMEFVAGHPRSRDEAIANIEKRYLGICAGTPFGAWMVRHREGGHHLGLGLMGPLDDRPEIEVGYRFFPEFWGRGYATEVTAALLAYGFDDLDLSELVAVTAPGNTASQRVLEKCGLASAGTTTAYGRDDLCFFRLARADWQQALNAVSG